MNHDLDLACWLLGSPRAVTAHGLVSPKGGWDQVLAVLDYPQASAVVEGSAHMPLSFPFSTALRVVCEGGALDLNWVWSGDHPVSEIKLYPSQGEPSTLPFVPADPYETECRYFVDCLNGQADPSLMDIQAAGKSLRVSLAVQQSLQQNGVSVVVE